LLVEAAAQMAAAAQVGCAQGHFLFRLVLGTPLPLAQEAQQEILKPMVQVA
jgi:hypothetical protein